MAQHVNAQDLTVGTKFVHRGRTFTATTVGTYQGTIKVAVEGFKFPLDFPPLRSIEIAEDAHALATV
jgi:hypothetical protein